VEIFTGADRDRLQEQTSVLEALVADRTRELAATVKELESFAYSVAHDLRAPLRAIHSFSRALMEDYGDRFDGDALDFMQRIMRASDRMSQLIDDLLRLSHIGRGDIVPAPTDLSAMITEICMRLAEREPGRHVALDVQDGMVVQGDARLLALAFENVLDNAWKFTRKREAATVRAFMEEQDGRRIVRIADNGTGFDMRYRHKLFVPFQRLHRADDFEGTGIGLVIVARVVARHGGEVWIDGAEGEGTTVSLYIP
jgi:light-regulated signal transduction histidine kinase (bacteriophytochrome)